MAGIFLLLLAYFFCLPQPLFKTPLCLVLESEQGQLLGAKIAADGQWRFPAIDSVPEKFEKALLEFEDHRFYQHPGIDPIGLGRAFWQNIRNRRIVSGGSTITMQVMRMARGNKSRNFYQKLIEMIMATRLELGYSKQQILQFYSSHAPFGGNVVGLEAASWRYFGKSPHLLSWAEASMLAVLPNSPGLIHPGRNRNALLQKRNRLLQRLHTNGHIDQFTLELATEEPLPQHPLPLPQLAPHLLERAHQERGRYKIPQNAKIKSTLNAALQAQVDKTIQRYHRLMAYNEVHNLAAVVIDIEKNEVIAYVGNAAGAPSEAVDIITAPRSTGSILKPFLYALMIQEGQLHPRTLVRDVPTHLSGYRPENFHKDYDGMVTAQRALIRSLNIPMVNLLQDYGLEKFHYQLNKFGFTTINNPPSHYGLPLILGGAEATLWDLTNVYAAMARTLNHAYQWDAAYAKSDFDKATFVKSPSDQAAPMLQPTPPFLSTDAIWLTIETMRQLERPGSTGDWQAFSSSRKIAWKTGTSFGFRDAWAIGLSPKYAVGVWVGNADGEGRPGIIGVQAAAPVLFDIFSLLPYEKDWFRPPYDALEKIALCSTSGLRPNAHCPVDTVWGGSNSNRIASCTYHQQVHLSPNREWQVNSSCWPVSEILHETYFILPPVEEFYYKSKNPDYRTLPPFQPDCTSASANDNPMQLIYPENSTKIYVPVNLDGSMSKTVFKLAHRQDNKKIHWHLDRAYIGTTEDFHNMELQPDAGKHHLALVDEEGNRLELDFEIIARTDK